MFLRKPDKSVIMEMFYLQNNIYLGSLDSLRVKSTYCIHVCIRSHFNRPLDKNVQIKFNSIIHQPKHMLWVLKRTVSMRRFFWGPKTNVKTDG